MIKLKGAYLDKVVPFTGPSEFILPNSFINISSNTKVIKRYINQGIRGGSIKERWQDEDIKIDINGIILGDFNDKDPFKIASVTSANLTSVPIADRLPIYTTDNDEAGNEMPVSQLDELLKYLRHKGILTLITNELPEPFGDIKIYIESYSIKPETGYNYSYSITAYTDELFNSALEITK